MARSYMLYAPVLSAVLKFHYRVMQSMLSELKDQDELRSLFTCVHTVVGFAVECSESSSLEISDNNNDESTEDSVVRTVNLMFKYGNMYIVIPALFSESLHC